MIYCCIYEFKEIVFHQNDKFLPPMTTKFVQNGIFVYKVIKLCL